MKFKLSYDTVTLLFAAGPLILFLALLVGGVWGNDLMNRRSCAIYETQTGLQTQYFRFDECYIKTSSRWMPWSEFKARAYTKEQSK